MDPSDESSAFDPAGVFRQARAPEPDVGATELSLGREFAGVQLERLLGRGGMGAVYLGRDRLGRYVAFKVLSEHGDAAAQQRFEREGELAARLDHPGIVKVHAAGVEHGVPWLIQDLVEDARTLGEALETRDRPARLAMLAEVARALAYAHAQGIVHRDIKPSNVLVGADDRPRIADFGLARAPDVDRLTRSGAVLGSPAYMSPEQVNGEVSTIAPATDVWAMGVMLYRALTEEMPFAGMTVANVFHRILMACPPTPRSIDPTITTHEETVVLKALAPETADRYEHAGQIADDLEALVAGEPPPWSVDYTPNRWDRLRRRWRGRDPRLIRQLVAAALLVPILVGGLGWLAVRGWSARVEAELRASREGDLQAWLGAVAWAVERHDPLEPGKAVTRPSTLQAIVGNDQASSVEVATGVCRAAEALRGWEATPPQPGRLAEALDRIEAELVVEETAREHLRILAARLRASIGEHRETTVGGAEGALLQALARMRWKARGVDRVSAEAVGDARTLLRGAEGVRAAGRLAARIDRLEASLAQELSTTARGFGRLPVKSTFRAAVDRVAGLDAPLAPVARGLFAAKRREVGAAAAKRLRLAARGVRGWTAQRYRELIAAVTDLEGVLGVEALAADPGVRSALEVATVGPGKRSTDADWRGLCDLVVAIQSRGWLTLTPADLSAQRGQLLRYLVTGLSPNKPLPAVEVNRALLCLGVIKAPGGLMRRYLEEGAFTTALADPKRRHGDLYFLRGHFRDETTRRPMKAALAKIVADLAASLGDRLSPSDRKALLLPKAVPLASPLSDDWASAALGALYGNHAALAVNRQLNYLDGLDPRRIPTDIVPFLREVLKRFDALLERPGLPRVRRARLSYELGRIARHIHMLRRQEGASPKELLAETEPWLKTAQRSVDTYLAVLDHIRSSQVQGKDDVYQQVETVATKLVHSLDDLAHCRAARGGPADAAREYDRFLVEYRKRRLPTANMRLWYVRNQLTQKQNAKARAVAQELLEGLASGRIQAARGRRKEIEAGVRAALAQVGK